MPYLQRNIKSMMKEKGEKNEIIPTCKWCNRPAFFKLDGKCLSKPEYFCLMHFIERAKAVIIRCEPKIESIKDL